jgi:hypothetical protein
MKRGLTIVTAMLFAGAIALTAMAQSTDRGANEEAPAASAATNPGMGAESAANPATDSSAARADNAEMNKEQKPANTSAQPDQSQDKSNSGSTSDAGTNPSNPDAAHGVE